MMIEKELGEEKDEIIAKQATLESLMQKRAESAQQNAALDEQIAARISEISEAETKTSSQGAVRAGTGKEARKGGQGDFG